MAGAMGAENWDWRGEQLGRYEATIETGQSIFYFWTTQSLLVGLEWRDQAQFFRSSLIDILVYIY
jgi:hypothetical protein